MTQTEIYTPENNSPKCECSDCYWEGYENELDIDLSDKDEPVGKCPECGSEDIIHIT